MVVDDLDIPPMRRGVSSRWNPRKLSVTRAVMTVSSAGRLQPGSNPILVCHEAAHLCLISLLHIHMARILPAVVEQQ